MCSFFENMYAYPVKILQLNIITPIKLSVVNLPIVDTGSVVQNKRNGKYTLKIFLRRAYEVHGSKFNYSGIKPEDIKGNKSKIQISCNNCQYLWTPTISDHINHGTGCPNCAGQVHWNLIRFVTRAKEIHGDRFDYSRIKAEDIKGRNSKIQISCNKCQYIWMPTINHHINDGSGCPQCSGNSPWRLETLLQRGFEVHGNDFDYSRIKPEDIKNAHSKIHISCQKCHHQLTPTIHHHIQCSGCPKCRSSKGELSCQKALKKLNIAYELEISLESLPKKRYDFSFMYNDTKYLLEFDGCQHFEYNDFFHRSEEAFKEKRAIDVLKTQHALQNGCSLIRIDYLSVDDVEQHLEQALRSKDKVYYSDPEMYTYISSKL